MEWDDHMKVRLRGMWADGLSSSEIGRRLGVSKNSVVSAAHRHGCEPRPSPIAGFVERQDFPRAPRAIKHTLPALESIDKPLPPVVVRPVPAPLPRPTPVAPPVQAPPSFRSCQWPTDDGERMRWTFCGCAQVRPGKPYCAEHCAVAYRRVAKAA